MQVTTAGNCLRVEVLRGTHMPRMDWTGAADPYVVVTAQSEAGLQMFRCPTAWDTLVRPHCPCRDPDVAPTALGHGRRCSTRPAAAGAATVHVTVSSNMPYLVL